MMAWEWKKNQTGRPMYKAIAKLIYYWWFAVLYGHVGSLVDLVLVNSTWTYDHIKSLWGFFSARRIHILYPPCLVPDDTSTSAEQTSHHEKRERRIVSVGQFRPEKDHALQVESLAKLFEKYPLHKQEKVQLLLIGSCRNESDQERVRELTMLIEQRNLTDFVHFLINPPNKELQESMASSLVGIHTMRQEHFGIGIVEMMAVGLITIAHNSGGPKTDIVKHKVTGYLATTPEEYADALHEALVLPEQEAQRMREQARASVTRFSDRSFEESLPAVLSHLP
jgi:alpha-1,2-mannosyltransferase